ncbi:M14 family zinc carboxypeptidase [Nocardioides sp. Arc9.136]|uniref:M14 family zinc carboxypeptidase n=1 Tax=Nocardioides sp. Arc9.136 TaxID=2996826 RepID=UPI002666DC61|nr:M14 family zinc carboxypeptidase [Nocardioides sp. Arc9.136]WKN47500.1 M14 family zinc carboxypeptidase [Nocardioides sp. Arc9.136]
MRNTRVVAGATGLGLAATVLAWSGTTAAAEPGTPTPTRAEAGGDAGRGPGTAKRVGPVERAQVARAAAAAPAVGDPVQMPTSYPSQPELRVYDANPDDAAHTAELLGHPDLAPRLQALMERSDRISVQVVGQSTEGRDLYLVTLTAPETAAQTAEQTAWRRKIKEAPAAAAADRALLAGYKTPVWISNNIHGNEWEGTDAAMRYIEHLATAPLAEVGDVLSSHRLYFSPSLNPDGRTKATRATALGLDPNRDMITSTTPESRSFVRTAQAIQPIYAADFHGYTGVLQMEPCGPPHGSNYEYDLYLPHNYALALKVEQDVVAAEIPGNTYYDAATDDAVTENTGRIKIPYRDTPDGWDDFPPIFTAQYAAYYGAATATVELPLSRNAPGGRQSPANAKVNVAVAQQTMESIVGYLEEGTNAREMLRNQIEVFRRGTTGAAKESLTTEDVAAVPGPSQWKEHWDVADDQEPVSLPRAYVIPVGAGQRSTSDATRLVRHLIDHEIEVGTLRAPARIGGTTYPRGSYVVDLHQPLRGLANALLAVGDDISDKVPSMYDISAWSLGELWGATVEPVGSTTGRPIGKVTPLKALPLPGRVPAARGPLTFDVAGVPDFQALNALLEDDVAVSMLADGSAVVEAAGWDEAKAVAKQTGVRFAAAERKDLRALRTAKGLEDLTVGYVGTQDDRLSLTELGFDDLTALTAAGLETDASALAGVDVLWIGSSFAPAVGSAARTAVQAWVDAGGSIAGRGAAGFDAAKAFGLLEGTAVTGNRSANGIVAVDTPATGVLSPYAQDTSFIYPATWFTGLGEAVTVEQRYDAAKPFLAGHWLPTETGGDGPDAAAGQPSAVSAEAASGARAFVLGTAVFFRTHPKGGLTQAARGLFWAAPAGDGVEAPQQSRTRLTAGKVGVVRSGKATVRLTVALEVAGRPATGRVVLAEGGRTLRTVKVRAAADGRAVVQVRLRRGVHTLRATYAGNSGALGSRDSVTVRVR